MDFNFEPSQKLLVCLTNGDIFEGVYQHGSKNRIDLSDISEHPSGPKICGLLSFYRNEIESITLLQCDTANGDDEDGNAVIKQNGDAEHKDTILLCKNEYERLKDLSR